MGNVWIQLSLFLNSIFGFMAPVIEFIFTISTLRRSVSSNLIPFGSSVSEKSDDKLRRQLILSKRDYYLPIFLVGLTEIAIFSNVVF